MHLAKPLKFLNKKFANDFLGELGLFFCPLLSKFLKVRNRYGPAQPSQKKRHFSQATSAYRSFAGTLICAPAN